MTIQDVCALLAIPVSVVLFGIGIMIIGKAKAAKRKARRRAIAERQRRASDRL